jgi:hypothetical protein
MITARIASPQGIPAPAAAAVVPGDWPGPAMNDLPYLARIAAAG